MSLLEHAKTELSLIGGSDDEMQQAMHGHILAMVDLFAKEGHSGFSASYAIGLLEKLLRFEPLKPLTGADDEWLEIEPGLFQNKRCSHVFKDPSGAYDINDGNRVYLTFPYMPKSL